MKRTQTLIAVLSIALGVAAFTTVIAIREWQRQQIDELADSFAPDVLVVRYVGTGGDDSVLQPGQENGGITGEEAAAFMGLPGVADVGYFGESSTALEGNVRITRTAVTEQVFDVLDLEVSAGRALTTDDRELGLPVTVLGSTIATELYGGAETAIGKVVELGFGIVARVVGVLAPLPAEVIEFPVSRLDVSALVPDSSPMGGGHPLGRPVGTYAFVRHEPGEGPNALREVRAALGSLSIGQVHEVVTSEEWLGSQYRFRSEVADELTRGSTWVVVLALVATVGNLANALGLRAADRARPLAVRRALGATRTRIALEVAADGLLVGGVGTAFGLALWPVADRFVRVGGDGVPFTPEALLYGIGAGLTVTLLAAAVPAIWTLRLPIYRALREELSPPVWEGVALTGMAAGVLALMVSTSIGVGTDTWFQQRLHEIGGDRLVLSNQQPPGSRASIYPPPPIDELDAEAVAAVPGVEELVLSITENTSLVLEGQDGQKAEPIAGARVDAEFFTSFPRPIAKGRPPVDQSETIIGPSIAELVFPGVALADVVGRTITLGRPVGIGQVDPNAQELTVVGVYASQPFTSMGDLTDRMIVRLRPADPPPMAGALVRDFHVRLNPAADREAVITQIRNVIDERYQGQYAPAVVYEPAGDLSQVRSTMADVASAWSTVAWLSLIVGAAGLASIVTVRLVKARPELALKRALGATMARIAAASTGSALKIATYAALVGLVLAVVTVYWVSTLAPWDFVVPLDRAVLVLAVAIAAALVAVAVPVTSFSRTPPWSVLKEE